MAYIKMLPYSFFFYFFSLVLSLALPAVTSLETCQKPPKRLEWYDCHPFTFSLRGLISNL